MKILKITNLKTGQVQQSDFKTIEELNEHFGKHKWGEEEKIIVHPAYEINHDEIPEVIGQEASAEVPAVLDSNGVEISPLIPAKEFIQAVPFQAAFIEIVPERIEIIPCEYTKEILDTDAEEAQKKINEDALKYLADTDYLAIRLAETGKPMPAGVAESRAAARLSIIR